MFSPLQIAKVCHDANKSFCELNGDLSQVPWSNAPEWQRDSALNGVNFLLGEDGRNLGPAVAHENWMAEKLAAGWKYGPTKNTQEKTHPSLLPFDELLYEEQMKDVLFHAIVNALSVTPAEIQQYMRSQRKYQENEEKLAALKADEESGLQGQTEQQPHNPTDGEGVPVSPDGAAEEPAKTDPVVTENAPANVVPITGQAS